jgi:hypothetical protein
MPDSNNTPSITNDEKVNVNRSAIEHRATWMGLMYEAMKKAGASAGTLAREAVTKTGGLHGAALGEKINGPVDLENFAEAFLTELGTGTFEMEVTERTKDALAIRFHYCPLVAGWVKAGIPAGDIPTLCDIAMDGDRMIAGTLGLGFELGATIAGGHPVCELRFFKRD